MSIDVYQFRPDVNRIIRGSNLATITSRKVRRQLEAEKRMNLCPVKQDLDRLINECFEDIYLPPIPRVPQAPVVPCPQPIYPASYNHVQSGEVCQWPRDPTFQFGVDRKIPNPRLPIPKFDLEAAVDRLSTSQPRPDYKPEKQISSGKRATRKRISYSEGAAARRKWQVQVVPWLAELIRVERGSWFHIGDLLWEYIKAHGKPVPGKSSYFGDAKIEAMLGPRTYTRSTLGRQLYKLVTKIEE